MNTRVGNQLYMFAGILVHNLTRELQIELTPRARGTTAKRAALWCFREIETLRRTLIQRAGRIIRPAGKLILSMNSNDKLENELLHSLGILKTLRTWLPGPRVYATMGKESGSNQDCQLIAKVLTLFVRTGKSCAVHVAQAFCDLICG